MIKIVQKIIVSYKRKQQLIAENIQVLSFRS